LEARLKLCGQAGSQPIQSQSDIRDLEAKKAALLNESKDLTTMAQSLQGTEQDTLLRLTNMAQYGMMELDATGAFLAVYDKMQCEPDRAVAKAALKNRLAFYSGLLGMHADGIAGYLTLTKLPATAQAGFRLRDDLRVAKRKLDAIADSLK
jgi:hypothetical protein